jgi:rubrerythrin
MDWLNFLKVMIIEERAARDKYQVAVDLADDPAIRAVFEKLRDEEDFHADFLEGEYERLEKAMSSKG